MKRQSDRVTMAAWPDPGYDGTGLKGAAENCEPALN